MKGREQFNAEEYWRKCNFLFEEKIDSLKLPIGDIETNFEKILENLKEISEISSYVNIEFDKKSLDGFNFVEKVKDRIKIAHRDEENEETFSSTHLLFIPKSMMICKNFKDSQNYILLLTKRGEAVFNDAENPEMLIQTINAEGKKEFFPIDYISEIGGFYNFVFNFYKENSMILLHPKGSIYSINAEENYNPFSRFSKDLNCKNY